MPETSRLVEASDWIDLDFLEREATSKDVMKVCIHAHVAGLSLADTVRILGMFGVDRGRSTIFNWRQKADLSPADGYSPEQVVVDETVLRLDDDRGWLYAAVDPATNRILHFRLATARTYNATRQFLRELKANHHVDDSLFLVDKGPWLQAALHSLDLRFYHVTHGNRNAVERIFIEIKQRTKPIQKYV